MQAVTNVDAGWTDLYADATVDAVSLVARLAQGATRFCMGAAYRNPKPKQLEQIKAMVREVRALGLETCATLGMLSGEQAQALKAAGLVHLVVGSGDYQLV